MIDIFKPFRDELKPFKEYWVHIFDKKRMSLVADTNSKVVHFSKLGCELFPPAIITNKASSTTAVELGMIAVNALLVELQDTRKVTSKYL